MEFTDAQRELLDGPYLAIIATIGPSGRPHTAPVWYVRDGDVLLMVTGRTSQKYRNLERDARASIVIDKRDRPYHALMIDCTAEVTSNDVDAVRVRTSARYLSPARAAAYVESRRGADAAVIRLIPDRVSEFVGET